MLLVNNNLVINKLNKRNDSMSLQEEKYALETLKYLKDMTKKLMERVSYNGLEWMEGDLVSIKDSFVRIIVKLDSKMAQTEQASKK